MVAERAKTSPAPEPYETPEDEPPDFSRYSTPVDRGGAGAVDTPGGVIFVPLVFHPSYAPRRRVTAEERREALIRQAAIRILAGLEVRTLRELADEIGCAHTAIDNIVRRMARRLGLRTVRVEDSTRAKLRAAASRRG